MIMEIVDEEKPTDHGARSERQEQGFTPGPWMYRPNPGKTKKDWTFHIDRQGTPGRMNWGILIAACWGHVSESAEANARLIAAAPALYAAAKKAANELAVMLALNPARGGGLYREALDALNAALALVDGKQQTEDK